MKASSIRPRPDQIAELTRNLPLPFSEVPEDYLEIIAEKLVEAFAEIIKSHPSMVATGSEAEVTALLGSRLNSMMEEDPLWGQLVICATRGAESLSFDGSHLEKRPDLSLHLASRARNFPLIVEAKIIDRAKDEKLYCENGVRRFVEGEYAWASREAFMVAYVRDKSTIAGKLTPHLTTALGQTPPGYLVEEIPFAVAATSADLARSRHGRSFVYPHKGPPPVGPGSIAIWHLWLS